MRRKTNNSEIGCLVWVILGILFMPIVGAFMIGSKDPTKSTWGWILLVAGVILWLAVGLG